MTKIQTKLNSTVDGTGNIYSLFFEVTDSSINGYADIRFYSTLTSAKDPTNTQDKWRTTIPIESLDTLNDAISEFLREKVKEKL
jgi:hypothetical protein